MTKAVLFDLDETLIHRDAAIGRFVAAQYARFASALAPLTETQYSERFLDLEDDGRIDKQLVYPALVKALGITGVTSGALLADYRATYPGFATLNPGAMETLRALHDHGLKLGIVTNGNAAVQNGKIDAIGIRPLLSCVVISETAGLRKPDPAIFQHAADLLGVAAADCVFVGDNPEVDVIGATAAGMRGVWFKAGTPWPATLPPPALAIDALPACVPIALSGAKPPA